MTDVHSNPGVLETVFDVIGILVYMLVQCLYSLVQFVLPTAYAPVKTVKGEIILITGGGSGIGRMLATKLAKLKATIVIWDINVEGMDETVKMVKSKGGKIFSYKCDITKRNEVYAVAEVVRKDVGNVSILINNAGIVSGYYLLDTPDHLIQRTFDVNIISHFWTVKAFLPKMLEDNRGHIVTIASMAGHTGCKKMVDYCASKHAAVGFDLTLRLELESLGATGVKTTVVKPFFIQSTGMFGDVQLRFSPALTSEHVTDKIVMGIMREDLYVFIPGHLRYMFWWMWILPWKVVSKFMHSVIVDACPTGGNQK